MRALLAALALTSCAETKSAVDAASLEDRLLARSAAPEPARSEPAPSRFYLGVLGGGATGFRNAAGDAVGFTTFELASGASVRPWLSFEGFFRGDFASPFTVCSDTAAQCTSTVASTTHTTTWTLFGARAWFHFVHAPHVDAGLAPTIGAGLARDQIALSSGQTSTVTSFGFLAGAALAVEARSGAVGMRLALESGVHLATQAPTDFYVAVLIGPLLRF